MAAGNLPKPTGRVKVPEVEEVFAYLRGLQNGICGRLEEIDGGGAAFREDAWTATTAAGG